MIKFSNMISESKTQKIKLSLDIHGVVDAMPDFFSFLSAAIVNSGGELHILTGGEWNDDFEKMLNDLGIKWTHKFSVYDHLKEGDYEVIGQVQFPDGTIQKKFKNEDWDRIKGEYCKEREIDLHIDDTLAYNDYFTTPFCRLWSHNNKPKASHKDIRHMD